MSSVGAYGPGIRVVRDSGVYIVGDVLRIALAWIMLPLYATYLQAAEYGIVAAAATVGAIFVVVSQLGLSAVVVRCCFDHEGDQRRKFLFSLWILIMAVAAILVIVAELAGEWIFARCLPGVAYQPYIRLAILNAWLSSVLVVPLGFLRADSRPVAYVCVSLSGVLMTVLSAWYLLVIAGWATRGALWGQILGTASAAALGATLLISYTGLGRLAKGGLGSALRLSVPMLPHQLSSWVLNVSDRWLLVYFTSLSAVGVYSLGYQIGTVVIVIAAAFNLAFGPLFYAWWQEPSGLAFLSRVATWYWVGLVALGLAVSLLAGPVLDIMGEGAYSGAVRVVPWVAAAGVVNGFYFIPNTVLMANKDVIRLPLYTLLAAVVNVGLNLLLIPKLGMMAAAYATLAGYLVLAGLTWADARRKWPFPYEYRKMALAAAVALVIYSVASRFTVGAGWAGLVVRTGWAFAGFGLLVLGTLGVGGVGRRLIRSV